LIVVAAEVNDRAVWACWRWRLGRAAAGSKLGVYGIPRFHRDHPVAQQRRLQGHQFRQINKEQHWHGESG
jgi:hypothetical protein